MMSSRLTIGALALCISAVADAAALRFQSKALRPDAQASFDQLKTLAGYWKGTAAAPGMESTAVRVTMRVTSGGAALMHEMVPEMRTDDPTRGDDDPVTMIYVDGARLLLTHYCDSGRNRPRMTGALSSDRKTIEFDFLDLSGETKYGHMHHAAFTSVDADHHTEDWTYVSPSGQPARAHIDLTRAR